MQSEPAREPAPLVRVGGNLYRCHECGGLMTAGVVKRELHRCRARDRARIRWSVNDTRENP